MKYDFPSVKKTFQSYWSVDSSPEKLTRMVPYHYAPMLLVIFALLSWALLYIINTHSYLKVLFPNGDLFFYNGFSGRNAISLRIFFVSFFIAFSLLSSKRLLTVIDLIAELIIKFMLICIMVDTTAYFSMQLFQTSVYIGVVSVTSGVLGFILFSLTLLERGKMPVSIKFDINAKFIDMTKVQVAVSTLFCAVVSFYASQQEIAVIDWLKELSLLGGIGPGIFLFFPMLFMTYFLIGMVKVMRHRNKSFFADVTILIPAHNEEYIIEKCVKSIDIAAKEYEGKVSVIVVNNCSTDNTLLVAQKAVNECDYISGVVIDETTAGKANALNKGLSMVNDKFLIRVDADTMLRENCLRYMMQHFSDEKVGAVGGVPLSPGKGMFDRAREVETIIKHGFYSVGLGAINSIVSIPGMCVCYRARLIKEYGGFASGLNGEDTEMSLRIGEAGYQLIVDPRVRYISEVPTTYHHLREQRMRWYRSVFHVSSRCRKSMLSKTHTVRGVLVLPFMLFNIARRSMMLPLLIFGIIEYSANYRHIANLHVDSLVAVLLGPPVIIALFTLTVERYFKDVLYLPEYFLFRILRTYFTLESILSIEMMKQRTSFFERDYQEVRSDFLFTEVKEG